MPHPVTLIREPWKEVFWSEVATVARALLAEQDLDDQSFTVQEWLDLRILTISGNLPHFSTRFTIPKYLYCSLFHRNFFSTSPSQLPTRRNKMLIHIYILPTARPLLVLLQASFNLPPSSETLILAPLKNLPMILGLQNDILGFDKDNLTANPLSAIQILIRDGMEKKEALLRIVGLHNRLVMEMMVEADRFEGTAAEKSYVAAASTWPNAMALWMMYCDRYKV